MDRRLAHALALLVVAFLPLSDIAPARAVARENPPRAKRARGLEKAPPRPAPRSTAATSFADWVFWYHNHADRLEALAAPRRAVPSTGHLPSRRRAILDTLRSLLEPRRSGHAFTTANACRALGRVTRSPDDATRLAAILADPSRAHVVREGAALGLGLLRRSGAVHALPEAAYVDARKALLSVADDESAQARLRGFSMLALGLLADQPHGAGDAGHKAVAERLIAFVRGSPSDARVATAALHALALQPAGAVDEAARRVLTDVVATGKIAMERVDDLTRTYAVLALGRHGTAQDVPTLVRLLAQRRGTPHNVRRSAAIAIGLLSAGLPLGERETIAKSILGQVDRSRDGSTRHFLLMALVPLLTAGPADEMASLLLRTRVDEKLLKTAARGRYLDRPHGALALGLILRETDVGATQRSIVAFRTKALETLRKGLYDSGAGARSAFALALGLARDGPAMPMLRAMAVDERRDATLRGYALLALPFGAPDVETHRLAREQLERTPGGLHALAATRVLGLTGDHADAATVSLLAPGVRGERRVIPCGEAAVALARIGTVEAADVLLAVARDPTRAALARCMAVVGLGRILDPERVPSLCLLTEGLNHRAMTDLVNELLSYY